MSEAVETSSQERKKREPRLTVARLRRSARQSSANQPEPIAGPSIQLEPIAGPSEDNRSKRLTGQANDNLPERTSNDDSQAQVSNFKIFSKTVEDFCTNTTVHGFRYFTEPKRHWVERAWWIIAVVASIFVCGFVIRNIWMKWDENPVIISFDDKVTSIGQIPFPAVTVCPTKKFLKEKVNVGKLKSVLNEASNGNQTSFKDLSFEELSQMNAILQTCSMPLHSFPADLAIPSTPTIYETIEDITVGKELTAIGHQSAWKLVEDESKHKKTFTDDGLCYTFNSLNSHEIYADGVAPELLTVRNNPNATRWNREDGYQSNVNESDIYPYRTVTSDLIMNLRIVLHTAFDDSHEFCSPFAAGFHVSLHAPDDLPQPRTKFIHIPPEQYMFITVQPNVVTTSNGLRSYDPHKRGCYFQSERRLRFFKSYSEQKCQLECLTDFTRDKCGCVHFAMPRQETTKVCTILDMECYLEAKQQFDRQLNIKQCDCLPDCFSISYDAEIAQTPYTFYYDDKRRENRKFLFNRSGFQMDDLIIISFKEENFISSNRSESSTMSDFLSSCGGLLGLFMGISVLSIVELIYYFTLRLWVNWKQQNKVQPIEQPDTIDPPAYQGIINDYFTNSNVHGLRYFTEPKRHRVERVWWVVVVAASFIFCGIVIQNIWSTWHENPVIVSFDDELTSIDRVPFPAVTICANKNFVMKNMEVTKLFTIFSQTMKSGRTTIESVSPEEISQLDAVFQTNNYVFEYPSNFSIPTNTLIYDALKNISLEEKLTIQSVEWLGQLNQVKLQPIFTGVGLCYTFNSLNSREIYSDLVAPELLTVLDNPNAAHWNRQDGYKSNVNESDVYPYRLFSSDIFDALVIRLGMVIDVFFELYRPHFPPSFYISLHAPDEPPQLENYFMFAPSEHDTFISVRPTTMTTSNGLRDYSPHKRGCYFQDERQLHFFRSYSQFKCRLECINNFTTKQCGCTYFQYPRHYKQEKATRICTMIDLKHLNDAYIKFHTDLHVNECDCLPDCTSISYHTEVSQAPYHYYEDAEVKEIKKVYTNPGYLSHSKLHISFKEDHFISVNRAESSTMFDFISNCGGLLGLFMGISLISIVELVYYFTLRLGVNWWRQRSDQINAAAARIKRSCAAFFVKQWEKLKKFKRDCGAFIANQWEKLKERKRRCVAFIANQWEKLMQRKRDFGAFMMTQWEKLRKRFQTKKRSTTIELREISRNNE